MTNWLKNEESGQGMVEYGLIIALMAAVIIAGIAILGPKIKAVFEGMNFGAASGG
ncbi:MAG: Flp family type IVb pilin [Clostridia bacterium]|nr:Flp family type IVb pilin [Clostridia bacterium]